MKVATLTAALVAGLAFVQLAEATERHYRHIYFDSRHNVSARGDLTSHYFDEAGSLSGYGWSSPSTATARVSGGRPAAWCGWQMRQLVGGDPGPEYNLARNWAHWGHAGPPGIGAVVVWSHHVGKIVGQENGMWIIQSGNDGNRLRTRPMPISRAIAIRWG
jgi:hypothetical protein